IRSDTVVRGISCVNGASSSGPGSAAPARASPAPAAGPPAQPGRPTIAAIERDAATMIRLPLIGLLTSAVPSVLASALVAGLASALAPGLPLALVAAGIVPALGRPASAGWQADLDRFEYTKLIMGVQATITLYASDEATA